MRPWLQVFLCIFAAGCINTSVQRVDQAVRPAQSPEAVTLLFEPPPRPYTVIAVVEATGETIFDSFDDLRDRMIAETAQLGGAAVIVGPESTDTDFLFTGVAMIKSDRRKLTGEVIVFEAE